MILCLCSGPRAGSSSKTSASTLVLGGLEQRFAVDGRVEATLRYDLPARTRVGSLTPVDADVPDASQAVGDLVAQRALVASAITKHHVDLRRLAELQRDLGRVRESVSHGQTIGEILDVLVKAGPPADDTPA